MEDIDLTFEEANNLIRVRCERILEKFDQVVVSGVKNPKLLAALEDIKNYWRDYNRPTLTFFRVKLLEDPMKFHRVLRLCLLLLLPVLGYMMIFWTNQGVNI